MEGEEIPRMQRVKVYRLNSDGLWDDKGTGHVSVEYLEVGPCSLCLPHSHGILYEMQQGCIPKRAVDFP